MQRATRQNGYCSTDGQDPHTDARRRILGETQAGHVDHHLHDQVVPEQKAAERGPQDARHPAAGRGEGVGASGAMMGAW